MAKANSENKRRVGRPSKRERPVTPEVLEEMGQLYLRGKSERQIGQIFGLALSTVQHHLNHTIKPLWRNRVQWDAAIELERADEVIRLAMEGFDRSLRTARKLREKYGVEEIKAKVKKKAPKAANKRQLVERTLERIKRDGDRGWLELVHLMMDFKAKVKGGYAPARLNISQQSELRVAGMSPAQLDQVMLARAAELIVERQRHQKLIESARANAGIQN